MDKRLPVILIPGIQGSQLRNNNEVIWMDLLKALSIPDILELQPDGVTPMKPGVHITVSQGQSGIDGLLNLQPICRTNPDLQDNDVCTATIVYDNMVKSLLNQGYVIGETLFGFPYDWRLDNRTNGELLLQLVQQVAQKDSPVQIVAHSMGGLVVKDMLVTHPEIEGSIDRILTLGTPYLGAPKASVLVLTGMGFIGNDYDYLIRKDIGKLSVNAPAAYQLAPSALYNERSSFHCEIQSLLHKRDASTKYPNQNLWQQAVSRHDLWDNSNPAPDKHIHYVGYDVSTIQGFTCAFVHLPIIRYHRTTDGDGTVPLTSSTYSGNPSTPVHYVEGVSHGNLVINQSVIDDVLNVLRNKESTYPVEKPAQPAAAPQEETSYALAGDFAKFADLTIQITDRATGVTKSIQFNADGKLQSFDVPAHMFMLIPLADDHQDLQIFLPAGYDLTVTAPTPVEMYHYNYTSSHHASMAHEMLQFMEQEIMESSFVSKLHLHGSHRLTK